MSVLFSPWTLGPLALPNRIAIAPMYQYSTVDGLLQHWHAVHYGQLALSGAGLLIVEATGVCADGRITPGCAGLYTNAHEAAFATLNAHLRALAPATEPDRLAVLVAAVAADH